MRAYLQCRVYRAADTQCRQEPYRLIHVWYKRWSVGTICTYKNRKEKVINENAPHSADRKPRSQDRAVRSSTFFLRTFWKFICIIVPVVKWVRVSWFVSYVVMYISMPVNRIAKSYHGILKYTESRLPIRVIAIDLSLQMKWSEVKRRKRWGSEWLIIVNAPAGYVRKGTNTKPHGV